MNKPKKTKTKGVKIKEASPITPQALVIVALNEVEHSFIALRMHSIMVGPAAQMTVDKIKARVLPPWRLVKTNRYVLPAQDLIAAAQAAKIYSGVPTGN